jgi:tagatose 1,6-diphosphate aldolase
VTDRPGDAGAGADRIDADRIDAYRIGARRGLMACASERGTFAVLALDHRQNLRRELRPDDPSSVTYEDMVEFKRAVVRVLAPVATGTLLDPEIGAAQCIADGSLPPRAGLIVAIEATGFEGPPTARVSRILDGWSVEQAKRMGASAAKLLVYYHPDATNASDQDELVDQVARACRTADLALFVEPLSFSLIEGEKLTGEARRRVVVETARRLTAIGGDVLKAEFPYDPSVLDQGRWREACAELDEASALPWVLLSGGIDGPTFAAQVEVACAAGASGVLAGRSVWAEAATMTAGPRDAFLATTARERLRRLVDLVDSAGRPWHERSSPLSLAAAPGEGWFRDYGR